MQVEPERTGFITGHDFTGKLLLFDHEEHELVAGHFLNRLWSRSVDLTACPVVFGDGVDAEFDRFAGDG